MILLLVAVGGRRQSQGEVVEEAEEGEEEEQEDEDDEEPGPERLFRHEKMRTRGLTSIARVLLAGVCAPQTRGAAVPPA